MQKNPYKKLHYDTVINACSQNLNTE